MGLMGDLAMVFNCFASVFYSFPDVIQMCVISFVGVLFLIGVLKRVSD